MTYPKKLIEVALPLEAVNRESAREKSIRHGHPSTLHLWWARRPLAACRAVLFASLVDDPSSHPNKFPTEEAQEQERQRLFKIIEDLVKWENSNNETVLARARAEIMKSTNNNPPPVLDPFCGGGSIPLEAQRLGLEAYASDLNPVAVLITKALIEIPPKFANKPPVNPVDREKGMGAEWKGAAGLAADVRYYGKWMRDEAEKRIGHLYPKVKLPKEHGGGEATVIAWLWARTVECPNPACCGRMPLMRSFWLSTKSDRKSWVEPVIDPTSRTVRFHVKTGSGLPPASPKVGRGAKFRCLICGQVADEKYVRSQFQAKRNGEQLVASVVETQVGRRYVSPTALDISTAQSAQLKWKPEGEMNRSTSNLVSGRGYGIKYWYEIFTPRQLATLTTFCDLVTEALSKVLRDAESTGVPSDDKHLNDGGAGIVAYADAIATYLGIAASKASVFNNAFARWRPGENKSAPALGRQALPMVWDYAEINPLAGAGGDLLGIIEGAAKAISGKSALTNAHCRQLDARVANWDVVHPVFCTDPPYYDNIGYADLSDFFYIWLRQSMGTVYPDIFSTLLAPKAQELVAAPYRFSGDSEKAKAFFEDGLANAFSKMRDAQHPGYPLAVFYAFKQAEEDEDRDDNNHTSSVASTGWETMLQGLIRAGFSITGTWPMRTEMKTRQVAMDTNALASSIVLVCRSRASSAPVTSKREFMRTLRNELPDSMRRLQHGNIAPVDFAQSAIGPGMAVFSRYSKVLESDGSSMSVRTALALINQALDEVLAEQEGEYDADTRWAVAWFEQFALNEGPYGIAETLSTAKNTSVSGLAEAGILFSRAGKVRLRRRNELEPNWDPATDQRLTVWEVTQRLIKALEKSETAAAELLRQVGGLGEVARDLAYRLYNTCERKKWAQEALAYNSLVVSWPELTRLAAQIEESTPRQGRLV